MRRRTFLATGGVALAGCVGGEESNDPDVPDIDVGADVGDEIEYNSILLRMDWIDSAPKVEYRDPQAGTLKTWDPGEDKLVYVVEWTAENLATESLDYPKTEEFTLLTPEGRYDPRTEIVPGVSVDEIRSLNLTFPEVDGIPGGGIEVWATVFTPPQMNEYIVEWTRPETTLRFSG